MTTAHVSPSRRTRKQPAAASALGGPACTSLLVLAALLCFALTSYKSKARDFDAWSTTFSQQAR